jgi:hypothetical protein
MHEWRIRNLRSPITQATQSGPHRGVALGFRVEKTFQVARSSSQLDQRFLDLRFVMLDSLESKLLRPVDLVAPYTFLS